MSKSKSTLETDFPEIVKNLKDKGIELPEIKVAKTVAERIHPENKLDQFIFKHGIMLHPHRYRVAKLIRRKAMCAKEIAEKLGLNQRDVSWHLMTLSGMELVNEGEFRVVIKATKTRKGMVSRYNKLTKEGRLVFKGVTKLCQEIAKESKKK